MSALPSSQQDRRAALLAAEGAGTEVPKEGSETPATPVADTAVKSTVTISREEFNDLQAKANRVTAAEGRVEAVNMDVEALQARLTALEKAPKGTTQGDTPAAPATPAREVPALDVSFSDKENEDYGESRPYIEKVVRSVLKEVLPNILSKYDDEIKDVRSTATNAHETLQRVNTKRFVDEVKKAIPQFEEVISHKYWQDFLQSENDSGMQYLEILSRNNKAEKLAPIVKLFNTFIEKYDIAKTTDTSGYAGARPSGVTETDTTETGQPVVLPFSERKKAHDKFISGEIKHEEYEAIRQKYDVADREGRVDYTK